MTDPRWYSALNVVMHFRADITKDDNSKKARKAEELCSTAIALVGLQEIEQKQYWIQPVSDTEGSPDVRTITFYDKGENAPDGEMQDVEVVTYEYTTKENIINFLLRTKLGKRKSYDDKTTILLRVKKFTKLPASQEWTNALKNSSHRCPVIILGRINESDPLYTLIQVYPVYREIIEFNLPKLLKKQKYSGVLNLARGSKKKNVYHKNEKHCPFENLGIGCNGFLN